VLASHHGIPFYIVAPSSTVDHSTPTGADIPIEQRDPAEITARFAARNPAFDVTPAGLITAIVTEHGAHSPPYDRSLPQAARPIPVTPSKTARRQRRRESKEIRGGDRVLTNVLCIAV